MYARMLASIESAIWRENEQRMHRQVQFEDAEANQRLTHSSCPIQPHGRACMLALLGYIRNHCLRLPEAFTDLSYNSPHAVQSLFFQ